MHLTDVLFSALSCCGRLTSHKHETHACTNELSQLLCVAHGAPIITHAHAPQQQVGFVESITQKGRKSGAEAWSLRVHDVLQVGVGFFCLSHFIVFVWFV